MLTANVMKNEIATETNTITYSFGNITTNGKSGMPMLEVMANEKVIGYLSPFRKYSFQISRNINGECDMGASPVLGLKNILFAKPGEPEDYDSGYCSNFNWSDGSAQTELLYGLALTAVIELTRGNPVNFGKMEYADGVCYRNALHKYVCTVTEWLRG